MTAQELLNRFWDGRVPVDLRAIAHGAGIVLKGGTPHGASAIITRSDEQLSIEYSIADDITRQRFAVAHCIGHCVLGHARQGQRVAASESFSHKTGSAEDLAANAFALQLLIPQALLEGAVARGFTDVQRLSQVFHAPALAVKERVAGLKRAARG